MAPTVLLMNSSWWPCSAHVAIALRAVGLKVAAMYPRNGHPLAKTDAVEQRYVYDAISPLKATRRAIERSGADQIVPCDDRAVLHLHQLYAIAVANNGRDNTVARLIERSLGDPCGYAATTCRADLLREAAAAGILIPSTYVIDGVQALVQVATKEPFPFVLKAEGSWGGLGVRVVHDMEEARATYAMMARTIGLLPVLKRMIVNRDAFSVELLRKRSTPLIIAQSFVEGRPANCVTLCKAGKVLASIAVEVVSAQSGLGPATKVRLVRGEEMRAAAESLASRLNLSGFYGFDFMTQAEGGIPYLVEMNARCAMPCHLATQDGDLVAALASELLAKPVRRQSSLREGDVISYFPQAWLTNPEDETLRTGLHDVPWAEPRLVKELLLLPWPDRSLLARLSDHIRGITLGQRALRVVNFDTGSPMQTGACPSSWNCSSEPT